MRTDTIKSANGARTHIVRVFFDGRRHKRRIIKRNLTMARAKAYIASAAAIGRNGPRLVYVDGYAAA